MFESTVTDGGETGGQPAVPAAGVVVGFARLLAGETGGLEDAGRVELIRALEVLKCAAEGAQAVVAAELEASQRQRAAAQGVPAERRGRGIGHQVALARRESPHRGQRHLGLARVLTTELPHTLAALRSGRITEWQATLVARETACVSLADRRDIDRRLCGDPAEAERMGVREIGDRARRLAAELDPASVARRRGRAEAERCVSVRPAPETMTWLTGHLPVRHGVAVYAALKAEADRLVGLGDGRSRGQLMADTLVDRVLGGATATEQRGGAGGATEPGLTVNVVISAAGLLGGSEESGRLPGYGPVPAEAVRAWVTAGLAAGARVELRRLFADPGTGQLVQLESRARAFPRPPAELIELRDQRCRTPLCAAPVRHADHVVAHADHGPTSAGNGQGLCASCNHAKQAPGWQARPRPGPGHQVDTTTPTGHTHRSRAPALTTPPTPGATPRVDLLWAA